MQKRQLGYTDLQLTTVGLGTWAMGGPGSVGWGPQDDDEAIAETSAASDFQLSAEDIEEIERLLAERQEKVNKT